MKTVTLNNGIVMPIMGYGVWQISPEDCERLVSDALNAGYRSIDTAQAYYNEEAVGAAACVGDSVDRQGIVTVVGKEAEGFPENGLPALIAHLLI